jgi:hypothetical protein
MERRRTYETFPKDGFSVAAIPQQEPDKALTTTQEIPVAQTLPRENSQDPDLARLLDAWGKMDPKFKRLLLAALEPDRPGT